MNPIASYVQEFSTSFGRSWNRFWFTPVNPLGIASLRIAVGSLALWYLLSFAGDLTTWFGQDGLVPVSLVAQLTREADGAWNARLSYLYYAADAPSLWLLHGIGLLVVLAFTVGLATRVTSVLALAVVLAYVHRGPMITGTFEPVLTMALFYLCLAPCGLSLSLDSWIRRRRGAARPSLEAAAGPGRSEGPQAIPSRSLAAGIAVRLLQVHVAALYVMMALTKLGGSVTWWTGEAMWWLLAQSESRLVDWTFLAPHEYLINLWTQSVVALELCFGLLIWNRWARPLLLAASVVHWLLLGLVTGQLSFAAAMLVMNLAFVEPAALDGLYRAWFCRDSGGVSGVATAAAIPSMSTRRGP